MSDKIYFKETDIVDGIVTGIKKYGVFLSFEHGYIGLLHISEISKNFVNNISNYFHIGDEIKVYIKKVDSNSKFLNVSVKELPAELNPFSDIEPSKKVTTYLKEVNFSKLDKSLRKMIDDELEREKQNGN